MSTTQAALNFSSTFLRLRPDARVDRLPYDDSFWPRLMNGELGDFRNEYLVSFYSFDKSWEQWEVHPNGDEIVVLLQGSVDFIVELPDGSTQRIEVRRQGDFVFVPKGCWHTCDLLSAASMLFITAGEGTMGRPRLA